MYVYSGSLNTIIVMVTGRIFITSTENLNSVLLLYYISALISWSTYTVLDIAHVGIIGSNSYSFTDLCDHKKTTLVIIFEAVCGGNPI